MQCGWREEAVQCEWRERERERGQCGCGSTWGAKERADRAAANIVVGQRLGCAKVSLRRAKFELFFFSDASGILILRGLQPCSFVWPQDGDLQKIGVKVRHRETAEKLPRRRNGRPPGL